MAQFPGMLLWTDAWVADTKHLSRLERGTYHDLLVLMWRTPGCRVPNDDEWLGKHLGMTAVEVAAELRPIILEFCQTDGNWIEQKRLRKEFVRIFATSKRFGALNKRWREKQKAVNVSRSTSNGPLTRLDHNTNNLPSNGEVQRAEAKEVADKKPADMTLAEINRLRYGKPQAKPARLLATAPCGGALAREPFTEQDP